MVVTAADSATLLAEIGRLMHAAEQGKAQYRKLADRAAQIYAPAVHILGALTFAGWMIAGASWQTALTYAIAVLIITCPCALALAVPAVQIAAASRLFRQGIIVKAPDGLERAAEVDMVVFDKTGTLTMGRPELLDADAIPDTVLRAASSLAASSKHPYARAIVAAATARLKTVAAADDVVETPGQGLERKTKDGVERLGSTEWCGVKTAGAGSEVWSVKSSRTSSRSTGGQTRPSSWKCSCTSASVRCPKHRVTIRAFWTEIVYLTGMSQPSPKVTPEPDP